MDDEVYDLQDLGASLEPMQAVLPRTMRDKVGAVQELIVLRDAMKGVVPCSVDHWRLLSRILEIQKQLGLKPNAIFVGVDVAVGKDESVEIVTPQKAPYQVEAYILAEAAQGVGQSGILVETTLGVLPEL